MPTGENRMILQSTGNSNRRRIQRIFEYEGEHEDEDDLASTARLSSPDYPKPHSGLNFYPTMSLAIAVACQFAGLVGQRLLEERTLAFGVRQAESLLASSR